MRALKTKGGAWVKPGGSSGKAMFPGSYVGYEYKRQAPSAYPKTAQQEKVAAAGRELKEKCAGKKGSDFTICRAEVLSARF